MAKATQLTGRTMTWLREQGFVVDVVERQSPRPARKIFSQGRERMTFFLDRKRDLFGALDLVAVHEQRGIVGVQVTSSSNHAARRAKIFDAPELRLWIDHAAIWIVSWRKSPERRGSKRLLWKPRVEEVTVDDFEEAAGPRLRREWRRLAGAQR